jgi:hypothetical protein
MNFLRDNHWLEEKDDGKMKVTRDGKMWIRRYKFSILNK